MTKRRLQLGLVLVGLLAGGFLAGRLPAFRPYDMESGTFVAQIYEHPRSIGGAMGVRVCPPPPEGGLTLAGYILVRLTPQTIVADQRFGLRVPTSTLLLQPGQQVLIRPDPNTMSLGTTNQLSAHEIVILASDTLPVVSHCMSPSLTP